MNHFLDVNPFSVDEVDALHQETDLLEAFQSVLDELKRLQESNQLILDRLDEPPRIAIPGLHRGLAVNQTRLQQSIEFVCERHRTEDQRCRLSEKILRTPCSKFAKKCHTQWLVQCKRERVSWERLLNQFDVRFHYVEPGDTFDPTCHTADDELVVADPSLAGTVELALSPCYQWRDEHGVDQVIEAEVILRTEA